MGSTSQFSSDSYKARMNSPGRKKLQFSTMHATIPQTVAGGISLAQSRLDFIFKSSLTLFGRFKKF